MHIKIIYISIQGKSIGNIQNYEALEGVYWCNTTKHGYQSKRTYGKVVRKHKMDSYIVG